MHAMMTLLARTYLAVAKAINHIYSLSAKTGFRFVQLAGFN